jgi:hypothetical protein
VTGSEFLQEAPERLMQEAVRLKLRLPRMVEMSGTCNMC